ncbi:MAG: MFS transporter [Hyphomicrobiales bacterium]|nr:MFS transporter [Hyphomicrobiales bacterium]
MSEAAAPLSLKHSTLIVVATTTVQALATMAVVSPAAIAPEFARGLGLDPALIGYQVSFAYISAMLTSLFGGGIVHRLGACRTSQSSIVLSGIGIALLTIPALPAIALGSIVIGIGYGLTNPAASHLLARITTARRRNLIFSLKQTGVPLGVLATGLIVPSSALRFGTEGAFLIVTALCFAGALAMQPARRSWDADRDLEARPARQPFEGVSTILSTPPLRYLSLAAFCYAGLQISLMAYTVTLLVEDLGFGLVQAGILLSMAQVTGAVGRVVWGWLADRLGVSLLVLAGLGAAMAACALATGQMTPHWSPLAVQALLLVFGAVGIGWNGVYLAEVARLSPADKIGSVTGGSLALTFCGIVVLPSVFATAYGLVGSYTATFALASTFAMAGALLSALAHRANGATAHKP